MAELHELRAYGVPGAGDVRTMWDPANREEVEIARKQFNDLKARGFQLFAVKTGGEPGKRITEFDPELGKIIAATAMRGG